jgi:hypothetical protein
LNARSARNNAANYPIAEHFKSFFLLARLTSDSEQTDRTPPEYILWALPDESRVLSLDVSKTPN